MQTQFANGKSRCPRTAELPGDCDEHRKEIRLAGRPRRKEGHASPSSPSTPTPTPPRATRTPASSSATTRVLVVDTQATPVMAQDVIRRIREVTDKPIKYVVLTHYHAVRVLGASGLRAAADHRQPGHLRPDRRARRAGQGERDRPLPAPVPATSRSVPPGLTWPTMTFTGKMTLWLGKLEVQLLQLGRGHTKGDTVVWLPQERVLLSRRPGRVRRHAVCRRCLLQGLAADARQHRRAEADGAGARPRRRADRRPSRWPQGLAGTRDFIADVYASVQAGRRPRART